MFFNLHGLVSLELVDEPDRIGEYFRRRLWFFETDLFDKEPDIRIVFTHRIDLGKGIRFIGNKSGTTAIFDSSSICITSLNKKVSILLKTSARRRYEVTCEIGINKEQLFNLVLSFLIQPVLLSKDSTLVHSSSVYFNDQGLLFAAWRDTGKTTVVLKLLSEGAAYVSEDFTIVTKNGTMFSYPEPMNLTRPHMLKDVKVSWKKLLLSQYLSRRMLKSSLLAIGRILQKVPLFPVGGLGTLLFQLGDDIQLSIVLPVKELFPQAEVVESCPIHSVFLIIRTEEDEIRIEQKDTEFILDKLVSSLSHEIESQMPGLYEVFRFAFPEKGQKLMRERESKVREILNEALKGKPTYYVEVPCHCGPDQMLSSMKEYFPRNNV